jgi:hypothetical protein
MQPEHDTGPGAAHSEAHGYGQITSGFSPDNFRMRGVSRTSSWGWNATTRTRQKTTGNSPGLPNSGPVRGKSPPPWRAPSCPESGKGFMPGADTTFFVSFGEYTL